jgi:hypothetical protein
MSLFVFLFLYLNMLSAARIAGRSRFRIPIRERDRQAVYRVAEGVSWSVRLKTHILLVPNLRMYGAIPPPPLHAFVACIWTTRVGIGERYRTEKPANWWNLSVFRHFKHDKQMKHGGPGQTEEGWRAEWCDG